VLFDLAKLSEVARTLTAMATGLDELAELVDVVEQSAVDITEQMLRGMGMVHPPTVHVLSRLTTPQYIGSVAVRRFYPGADAARAVTALGWLPSVLCATHLVVVWEHADLCTALEVPGAAHPSGVVVVDASLDEHTVRWHPFLMHLGPVREDGLPTVLPEWGEPVRHPVVPLPDPVTDLLTLWRQWGRGDLSQITAELEQAGYRLAWAARG
jgi:hypothetical protein